MAIECLVLGKQTPSFSIFMLSSFSIFISFSFLYFLQRVSLVVAAGAGQEVGKSCVVVTINGKRIMFDCGMHMGYLDHRRYPDFSLISKFGDFNNALTCIIITHLYGRNPQILLPHWMKLFWHDIVLLFVNGQSLGSCWGTTLFHRSLWLSWSYLYDGEFFSMFDIMFSRISQRIWYMWLYKEFKHMGLLSFVSYSFLSSLFKHLQFNTLR